jgi:hypothetical protein
MSYCECDEGSLVSSGNQQLYSGVCSEEFENVS